MADHLLAAKKLGQQAHLGDRRNSLLRRVRIARRQIGIEVGSAEHRVAGHNHNRARWQTQQQRLMPGRVAWRG